MDSDHEAALSRAPSAPPFNGLVKEKVVTYFFNNICKNYIKQRTICTRAVKEWKNGLFSIWSQFIFKTPEELLSEYTNMDRECKVHVHEMNHDVYVSSTFEFDEQITVNTSLAFRPVKLVYRLDNIGTSGKYYEKMYILRNPNETIQNASTSGVHQNGWILQKQKPDYPTLYCLGDDITYYHDLITSESEKSGIIKDEIFILSKTKDK